MSATWEYTQRTQHQISASVEGLTVGVLHDLTQKLYDACPTDAEVSIEVRGERRLVIEVTC